MSSIRGVRDRRFKFVQLLNCMFEDPNIGLKAKGFIGFCLTKKDDWKFHISYLCSVLKEGEDAIYSTINECIDHGYAYRYRTRDSKGKLGPVEFVISDSKVEILEVIKEIQSDPNFKNCLPHRGFPDVDCPHLENPGVVFTCENDSDIYSNTDLSNTKEQQQQAASPPPCAVAAFSKKEEIKPKAKEPEKPKPQKPRVYECLINLHMPLTDKIEITTRYDEDTVKNATEWATQNDRELTKGLAPAIKYACGRSLKPEKKASCVIEENKSYAMNYDKIKTAAVQVYACNNQIEIVYLGCQKEPICIEYSDKTFLQKLQNALIKCQIKLLN
jgi:hypothetical protein